MAGYSGGKGGKENKPEIDQSLRVVGYEDWVRTGEAAKILGVSPQRLAQLIGKDRMEIKWTPYGRLVSLTSVMAYDESRRKYVWSEPQRIREAARKAAEA